MAPYEHFHIRLVIPPSRLRSFLGEIISGCHNNVGQKGATPSLRTIDRPHSVVNSGRRTPGSMLPVNALGFSHLSKLQNERGSVQGSQRRER